MVVTLHSTMEISPFLAGRSLVSDGVWWLHIFTNHMHLQGVPKEE